jgi:hypothetical protein
MKRVFRVLGTVLVTVVLLAMIGLGIGTMQPMPDNAVVLLDPLEETYIAPPCLDISEEQEAEFSRLTADVSTFEDAIGVFEDMTGLRYADAARAYRLEFRPDPDCRDQGAFTSDGRSLTGLVLQHLGILREKPRRWTDDGGWNW